MHITDPLTKISIPLLSKGIIRYADSHAPLDQEFQICCHVALASPSNWNPSTISLGRVTSREVIFIFFMYAFWRVSKHHGTIEDVLFKLSKIHYVIMDNTYSIKLS